MPSLSIGPESTRVYIRKATDGWIFLRSYLVLSSFLYFHNDIILMLLGDFAKLHCCISP
jgi:hypothetical protein